VIKIADNGNGMPPELIDKIFVPFFSTKKNGSGIGLSLCKQIMMLHRGNIQVQSVKERGTAFCCSSEKFVNIMRRLRDYHLCYFG
jgi:signal transduction histidine kinase